ncbi:hypothetical protein PMAYCL1PPCAC_07422, partial [Pristionchus mayeri]
RGGGREGGEGASRGGERGRKVVGVEEGGGGVTKRKPTKRKQITVPSGFAVGTWELLHCYQYALNY